MAGVAPQFNGSVFRDIQGIPKFYTVKSFQELLRTFIQNPSTFQPSKEFQERGLYQCFYRADGLATNRIAARVMDHIQI